MRSFITYLSIYVMLIFKLIKAFVTFRGWTYLMYFLYLLNCNTRNRIQTIKIKKNHWSSPGNGFITVSLSPQNTHGILFPQSNSFLAINLQLAIPKTRLNSIPSSYPGSLAFRNSTLHFTLCCWTLLYDHFARNTQEAQPLLLRRRVYWSVA
jgi:hypothetical protein